MFLGLHCLAFWKILVKVVSSHFSPTTKVFFEMDSGRVKWLFTVKLYTARDYTISSNLCKDIQKIYENIKRGKNTCFPVLLNMVGNHMSQTI